MTRKKDKNNHRKICRSMFPSIALAGVSSIGFLLGGSYLINSHIQASKIEQRLVEENKKEYEEYCRLYDITQELGGKNRTDHPPYRERQELGIISREQLEMGSNEPLYSRYLNEYLLKRNPDKKSLTSFAEERLTRAKEPIRDRIESLESYVGGGKYYHDGTLLGAGIFSLFSSLLFSIFGYTFVKIGQSLEER